MAAVTRLPEEVIANIAWRCRGFYPPEASTVALVCRAWWRAASDALFRTVDMWSFERLERFGKLLQRRGELGKSVRIMRVSVPEGWSWDHPVGWVLLEITAQLPALVSISLDCDVLLGENYAKRYFVVPPRIVELELRHVVELEPRHGLIDYTLNLCMFVRPRKLAMHGDLIRRPIRTAQIADILRLASRVRNLTLDTDRIPANEEPSVAPLVAEVANWPAATATANDDPVPETFGHALVRGATRSLECLRIAGDSVAIIAELVELAGAGENTLTHLVIVSGFSPQAWPTHYILAAAGSDLNALLAALGRHRATLTWLILDGRNSPEDEQHRDWLIESSLDFVARRRDCIGELVRTLRGWIEDDLPVALRGIDLGRDWVQDTLHGGGIWYETISYIGFSPSLQASLRSLAREVEAFGELCAQHGIVFK